MPAPIRVAEVTLHDPSVVGIAIECIVAEIGIDIEKTVVIELEKALISRLSCDKTKHFDRLLRQLLVAVGYIEPNPLAVIIGTLRSPHDKTVVDPVATQPLQPCTANRLLP